LRNEKKITIFAPLFESSRVMGNKESSFILSNTYKQLNNEKI